MSKLDAYNKIYMFKIIAFIKRYRTKIVLYFNTIKYLKIKQILYRIKYRIYTPKYANIVEKRFGNNLCLIDSIKHNNSYYNNKFTFLNITYLNKDINWEYSEFGKLWTYNLCYFDYLNQKDISDDNCLSILNNFINYLPNAKVANEAYPISLRVINWIKYFSSKDLHKFDGELESQTRLLIKKIEYHLLGNHLLENGFALLFCAYYYNDKTYYDVAKKILIDQLEEQVLSDGAHFELSPMYHSIILFRLLDSYNIVMNNPFFGRELLDYLGAKCKLMLSWINLISFKSGEYPLFNDSSYSIGPSLSELNAYAMRLELNLAELIPLNNSGIRKFSNQTMELVADVGRIGPDYQPGHAHADTFNFELFINNQPLIVDTGTSTYNINEQRFYERSTKAHNTVTISGRNSSQVWSGHRTAKRAKVLIFRDLKSTLDACHDGYSDLYNYHRRIFECFDFHIIIKDMIKGKGISYLHFYPGVNLEIEKKSICGDFFRIELIGYSNIEILKTYYSPQFNVLLERDSIAIHFCEELEMKFYSI